LAKPLSSTLPSSAPDDEPPPLDDDDDEESPLALSAPNDEHATTTANAVAVAYFNAPMSKR
jgi:hypothetical protein